MRPSPPPTYVPANYDEEASYKVAIEESEHEERKQWSRLMGMLGLTSAQPNVAVYTPPPPPSQSLSPPPRRWYKDMPPPSPPVDEHERQVCEVIGDLMGMHWTFDAPSSAFWPLRTPTSPLSPLLPPPLQS